MKRLILLSLLIIFIVSFGFGQKEVIKLINKEETQVVNQLVHPTKVSVAIYHDVLPSLKDLPPIGADYLLRNKDRLAWDRKDDEATGADYSNWKPMGEDPVWQKKPGTVEQNKSKALQQNFAGQTSPYMPSDCNGTVGPSHFFQTVNSTYAIYNKTGGTVVPATAMNTLFTGVTGASNNDGDPLILWDEQANVWVAVEFSIASTPDYMLFAVSQTSDPTGAWNRYSFVMNGMPDYEKVGIASDGYYMGTNTTSGDDIYVFERSAMIAGTSAQMIQFDNPNRPNPSGFNCVMPIDNDGTFDTGHARFIGVNDDAWGNSVNGGDELWIFDCTPDWVTTGNSTFGRSTVINVSAFDSQFNSWGTGDVAQVSETQLVDANPYVLMSRGQYKNISGNEYIVCDHTVDVDATNHAGIRWYQLQKSAGVWTLKQEGTYAPDAHSRWMGSIAMNDYGQIALAYSVSSSTMSPEIRYTGQTSCAPSGTLDVAEQTVTTSLTPQSQPSYNRWGDYFLTTVDPSDNLTFWSTLEYYNGGKKTQIFSYKIDESCAAPTISNVTPVSLYRDRGKDITITGTDFLGCTFTLNGIVGTEVSNDGSTAVINFPPAAYDATNSLVVSNIIGSDNSAVTVSSRTTIPVDASAVANSDTHQTISSATNGIAGWLGSGAFTSPITIEVVSGTYTEGITLNNNLNPTTTNTLTIQNTNGANPIVDATGNNYGFNLGTVSNVTLKGFQVHSANNSNIYTQGNNVTLQYNKAYNAIGDNSGYGLAGGNGIKVETGTAITLQNNLTYGNIGAGIELAASNTVVKNNTADDNGGLVTHKTGVQLFYETFEDASAWTSTDWGTWTGTLFDPTPSKEPAAGITNATDYITLTNPIDITGYTNLSFSIWVVSYGTLESLDNMSAQYSFDGSTWTNIVALSDDHITFTEYTLTGVTPTSNNLYLRAYGKVGNSEYWFIDDFKVTGDESFSDYYQGNSLLVSNGTGSTVENNIFSAKTGNTLYHALKLTNSSSINSDYNTYYSVTGTVFDNNGTTGNAGAPLGGNDLTSNPLFLGSGDYHILSTAGSYHIGEWPPTTATAGTWTPDASDSPAIDAGNGDAYANEPASNGSKINQGTYGNTAQASKTAAAGTPPTVSTQAMSSVSCTTATGNGNITDLGNPNPTAYGVCWNTTGAPTTGDSNTNEGGTSSTGAFTSSMTGLTAGTTYYVRAYATNTAGTSYGAEVSFTTDPTPGAAGSISGTATVCQGDNAVAYNVGAITDATSYTWTYSGTGATITGTTNSITIDFNASATSGNLTVYGTNACGNGTVSSNYAITVNNCSAGTYTISGTVKYDDASTTVVNGETVELYDNVPALVATTTTDASGAYSFTNVADGDYTVKPTGNLAWGGATAMDVTLYKMHLLGAPEPQLSGLKLASGDVNASGTMTAIDLTTDLQRIVASTSSFLAGDWAYTDGTVTVSGANKTVNLSAICYGDANTSRFGAKSLQTIAIENNSVIYVEDGDYFELQINLQNNIIDLSSVTLNIPFDANKFEITNVSMENNNSNMYYNVENGVLRIAYSSLNTNNYVQGDKFLKITGFVNNILEETNISNSITGEFGDYNSNVINSITFAMPSFSPKASNVSNLNKNIYIYPNPANNFLNILNAENSKVEVLNILGSKVLISQNIDKYNNRINTQNLVTGTYILKVSKNNKVIMKKFTIIK